MIVSNVTYSTASVANYTVMIMLMALRKMKMIMRRAIGFDYSLNGSIGLELENMVVGVIGTGAIGQKVIKNLSGFGCQILAYDPFEKEEVRKYADELETIVDKKFWPYPSYGEILFSVQ